MIIFPIGHSGQLLIVADNVLEHFRLHQQTRWWHREAGGQLFARIEQNSQIRIVLATGPRQSDKRSRFSYRPNRKAEQEEIDRLHKQNLAFVGDWHTHPEFEPKPSFTDLVGISNTFKESKHQLNAFVLVIVGKGDLPENLYVGLHNDTINYDPLKS